jgi:hypothetical protein
MIRADHSVDPLRWYRDADRLAEKRAWRRDEAL